MNLFFTKKDNNNARFGLTLQKTICDYFHITPDSIEAINQFKSSYDIRLKSKSLKICKTIFGIIGSKPVKCTTFAKNLDGGKSTYNFILENNSTLSIRTNFKGDKIAPREVGQAGFEKLNYYFSDIYGKNIENKEDIKILFTTKIASVLPIFINFLFDADYIVWIYPENNNYNFKLLRGDSGINIDYDETNFTFTRNLDEWVESTTLKYKGISIAEIQVHKNRTFKFRFIMKNLIQLVIEKEINNETLGITAEKTICEMFELKYPKNFLKRYSTEMQEKLKPIIKSAFTKLPKPIKHSGSESGKRGGHSKSSYDFMLFGNKELSLKTNIGNMVCPPEVGQPGAKTCYSYFGHLTSKGYIDGNIYKEMVLSNIGEMFPIFVNHLFDSDYLLWIYKYKEEFKYKIMDKKYTSNMIWNLSNFSFTRNSIEEWNESNTLKYDGISIGEFQVHKNRDCYKFRFNFENFIKVIERGN